jgi:mRNA interferase RelE/StbE
MAYKIEWDIRAYRELKEINNKDAVRILNAVNKLYKQPYVSGEPLEGKFKGKYRMRVGDYRVIYWVKEDEKTVYIISVGHRKDIYR